MGSGVSKTLERVTAGVGRSDDIVICRIVRGGPGPHEAHILVQAGSTPAPAPSSTPGA